MVNSYVTFNGNGLLENGQNITRQQQASSLPWLDIRVFYVRVSKCEINDSTPEYLTVNHMPLHPDTLLEVNGIRTCINSDKDRPSTLLRRDRLDKKSEEATFVSTDSIRITGSVKFEVFDKDVLVLSGVLELCNNSNGFTGELKNHGQKWSMNCESDIGLGTSFLKAKQHMSLESVSPIVEVYVAGSFSGNPTILTKTLRFGLKMQMRKGMLQTIPEYEDARSNDYVSSPNSLQLLGYRNQKAEREDYYHMYSGREYMEGEDGELSWFNAGVRVGVGIGLSVCLGVGIGVGLLVQAYQGTTRNFRRRL